MLEHLVPLFNTKFFQAEATFTFVKLDKTHKYPMEDLDMYVKKFQEKALDCCDPLEEVLINVCLHDIMEEYTI